MRLCGTFSACERSRAHANRGSEPAVGDVTRVCGPAAFFLAFRFSALPRIDVSSLAPTLGFAVTGAMVSAILGGVIGAAAGTLDASGRRWAVGASAALMAAPPAFWWIGLTRLPGGLGSLTGPLSGSVVAGCALAPVTLFLVLAATREIPSSAYEAARVALPPARRVAFILYPQLRAAVMSGFLLTVILLLGESEIPFLFGFRTSMTDVVTTFSQTYDVGRTLPTILPLVITVLLLGILMAGPLFSVILPGAMGGRGVVRKPAGCAVGVGLLILPLIMTLSLAGFTWMAISGVGGGGRRIPPVASTLIVSVAEPIACALASLALAVLAAYPARRSSAIRSLTVVGLLLFCVPAAVVAIGWIGVAQALDGISIGPALAHVSRTIGLPVLGFLIAYARLPPSLEDASRLVSLSPIRRAWTLVLPLLVPSLAATAALTGALIFADRDVASLLLAPGESRLMLNLYLLSANAPSAVIGINALGVFAAGAVVVLLAGARPFVLMARRRA
jgi:iron(III) transport system permease protein